MKKTTLYCFVVALLTFISCEKDNEKINPSITNNEENLDANIEEDVESSDTDSKDESDSLNPNSAAVQLRLENGETPFEIYQSDPSLLDFIYGQPYQDGLIFYLDLTNGGGLVAHPSDYQEKVYWGCEGDEILEAEGEAIGTGQQNTIDILIGCNTQGIAASICDNFYSDSYDDWFLPSKDELNQMYLKIGQGSKLPFGNIGGFADAEYWSSTESGLNNKEAFFQYFSTGSQINFSKNTGYFLVRPVRAFNEKRKSFVQERLDNGETPFEIYQSHKSLLDSLYGKIYQGGFIFYLDTQKGGGLVAAPYDQGEGAIGGCFGTEILGANGEGLGTGNQNTLDIISGCSTSGIAADICANLQIGDYSDWFLPSKDELNEMYVKIGQGRYLPSVNIGGFSDSHYWSSTEHSKKYFWLQAFFSGVQFNWLKASSARVRAARSF